METSIRSTLLASLPAQQARTTAVELLQGRIATAKVTAVLDIGTYRVELEGQSLVMRLPVALRAGEQFRVQLDPDATTPTLKLSPTTETMPQAMSRLLAESLPRVPEQAPDLATTLRALAAREASLPQAVAGPLRTLLGLLPGAGDISKAENLARWITLGGLMLERRLGQPGARTTDLGGDFKLALLRLHQALHDVHKGAQPRSSGDAPPGRPPAPGAGGDGRADGSAPRPPAAPRPAPTGAPTRVASAPSATAAPPLPGAAPAPASPGRPAPTPTPDAPDSPAPAAAMKNPHSQAQPTGKPAPARAAEPPVADTQTLESLLGRVREQVEQNLAKVQINQARLAQGQADGTPQWTLDIPLADRELGRELRLSIRDQRRRATGEDGWQAELNLEPPALGPIRVRLRLRADHLDTTIWAEQVETAHLLVQALPLLDSALANLGLQSTPSRCYCGVGPSGREPGFGAGILDERV